MVDRDWMRNAACRGMDPNLFHPGHGDNRSVNRAKKICHGCEVRIKCLEYALSMNEQVGIYGGCSEKERRRIRSQRRRKAGLHPNDDLDYRISRSQQLWDNGVSVSQIANMLGCSETAVYRYIKGAA